jgi:hypothetical protein
MEATSHPSRGSRRAFIAAGLGGLAATAAHALGRPLPVQAGHDGTNVLHIGEINEAPEGATTSLMTDVADSGATGFGVHNPNGQAVVGSSATGIGVFGSCDTGQGGQFHSVSGRGVLGKSQSFAGVQGTSDTGNGGEFFSGELAQGNAFGVLGVSGSGEGGHFQSTSGDGGVGISESGAGLHGQSDSGFGVAGFSGSGAGVMGHSDGAAGVEGGGDPGVWGASNAGRGVVGTSWDGGGVVGAGGSIQKDPEPRPPGPGVIGFAPGDAPGVRALSASDTGLANPLPDGGLALEVIGRARFSTAGSATVPKGANTAFVSNAAVTAFSHITVTLVSEPGPRMLRWVERDPGAGFAVHFSGGNPGARPATDFTYLIVEHGT